MDQKELSEILKNNWSIVPEDIRVLILSPDFETKLNWIGRKYNLTAEQTDKLKQETIFVLIGLVQLKNYIDSISSELTIPKEQVGVIVQEVETQVFAGVRESLKEMGLVVEMAKKLAEGDGDTEQKGQQIEDQTSAPKPVSGVLIQQVEKKEQEEMPKINRAVLLAEIEHPALIEAHAQEQARGSTIVDEKLGGIVKIPRQEAHVDMAKTPPVKKYTDADPYREAI